MDLLVHMGVILNKDEALRLALEALESNRRTHYYCEDTWYSCPKHEDGCANDSEGDECNCGADEVNAEIDQAITAIKAALEAKDEPWECVCGANLYIDANGIPRSKASVEPATVMFKPEQEAKDEPVAWMRTSGTGSSVVTEALLVEVPEMRWNFQQPLYTNPPQRKPLTDEQIDVIDEANWEEDHKVWGIHNFARAIEAAHGIKGEA